MNNLSAAEATHNGTSFNRGQSHQTDGLSSSAGGTVLTNGVSHRSTWSDLDDDDNHSGTGDDETRADMSAGDEDRNLNTYDHTASQDATDRISRHPTNNSRPAVHSSDNSAGGPTDAPASSQDGSKPSYQHKTTWGDTLQQSYKLLTSYVPHEARVAVEGAAGEATMQAIGATHKAVGVLPGPLASVGESAVNMGAGAIFGPKIAFGGYMRGVGLGGNTETRGTPKKYAELYDFGGTRNSS